ncbi:MAG TPA: type I-C CRISPR-associated protein Cas8c/Csd1 [Fimbriiglobus sp.]|jgi:CRISPR-associated protein Csd1
MILNRLYELAERKNLLSDTAFVSEVVPFTVVLGDKGKFLGLEGERSKPPKKGETRVERKLSIPRAHGNTASPGFARYFVDTLPRVLPISDEEKSERSRTTFWNQIDQAAQATDDPALHAVHSFGRNLAEDSELADRVKKAIEAKDPGSGDRVTFAFFPDGGKTILERPTVRQWYTEFYKQFTAGKQLDGPVGFCTITGTVGPLPTSHPMKLTGIPGGLPTGVSIVSFDKPAFQHYGLDGAANAAIGYEAADGYARGFQWLRNEKGHHFTVGGTLFLFWTREEVDTEFVMALNEPSAEQVEALLKGVWKGKAIDGIDDQNQFYLLAVSGNSARAIVREYLEQPIGRVRSAIRQWFSDLRIADSSKDHQGHPNSAFPMWLLANATALESDRVAPDTHARLMHSALTGGPLPDSILAACLGRLRAEGSAGFRTTRMALIKLCLNRTHCKENPIMPTLDDKRRQDKSYECGRLLAFLARCQSPKDFGTGAQILERFFGMASTSPRGVFPTLLRMNRHHINKIRDEMPGFAFNLEAELEERLAPLKPTGNEPADFPALLTLPEQGRFALGFYHQRADYRSTSADKKIAAAQTEN